MWWNSAKQRLGSWRLSQVNIGIFVFLQISSYEMHNKGWVMRDAGMQKAFRAFICPCSGYLDRKELLLQMHAYFHSQSIMNMEKIIMVFLIEYDFQVFNTVASQRPALLQWERVTFTFGSSNWNRHFMYSIPLKDKLYLSCSKVFALPSRVYCVVQYRVKFKHRKNCECCPFHSLFKGHYEWWDCCSQLPEM